MPKFAANKFVTKTLNTNSSLVGAENIFDIDNSLIDDSPLNEGIPLVNIESLAQSMKIDGLLEPLVVYKKNDGRYEIVSGHRRRAAWCGVLKNSKIKCRVIPYVDDPMTRFRQHAVANTQTREKDDDFWCVEIKHARKLVSEIFPDAKEEDRLVQISKLLDPKGEGGLSSLSIRRYEAYDSLIPELKQLRKYGLSAFTLSVAGFKHLTEDQQKELAEYVSKEYENSFDKEQNIYTRQMTRNQFNVLVNRLKEKGTLLVEKPVSKSKRKQAPLEERIITASGGIQRALKHVKTDSEKEKARNAINEIRKELDQWEKEYL